ncbi:hypothetical protein ACFP1Z_22920 [Streptomyces gamaensis]|uniref:Uncharacterized protein n=1 Tax=Streptomyces gamaensis TaxID=1763542 RepID=A0ABW0Z7H5_9ACTN
MHTPEIGEIVRDTEANRLGQVMAREGNGYALRPVRGGIEWTAQPSALEPLTERELLSARVAEGNAGSRRGSR